MTGAVSAKTVSAIETRSQPRGGRQGSTDAFRTTLDGVAGTDAGSTGRTGLSSAANASPKGYSHSLAGLGQQVIRLSVEAEASREENVGEFSLGREETAGGKRLQAGLLASGAEAAKAKNEAPIDLEIPIAPDLLAAEDVATSDAAAVDDISAEAWDVTQPDEETRDGGTAIAQLAAALMVPARETLRTGARSEGDAAGAGESATETNEDEGFPRVDNELGAGRKVAAAETSMARAVTSGGSALHVSELPKTEAHPRPADALANSQPASPREGSGQPMQAGRDGASGETGRTGKVSAPIVDAPEVMANVTRAAPSARDAAAVARADAFTVETDPPGQVQPVEIGAGSKQTIPHASGSGADPALARAGIMSSPIAPVRGESTRASRVMMSETKPHAGGAPSAPSTDVQRSSSDDLTAPGPNALAAGENAEAETETDLPQGSDDTVERAPAESSSRDTGHGLNTSSGSAAAPIPVASKPTTLTTTAAAVLEAIRSEAAWTAHLGNTRPEAPSEVKSLKISLTPVELGNVIAHMTIDDESVSVELTAETTEAQSRLAADTDTIIKSLRAIGLEVDRITVQLAPRADAPTQADTGAGARQQGFAADSGAGDARGQSSGSQAGRNASATEDSAVRTDTSATPNRNASSRYI